MKRAVFERRILVPALVAYLALVALAAWRHEIRPRWLDTPAAWARSALRGVGIRPAVAVFTADVGTQPDAKLAALCLAVRSVEAGGRVRQIYPPAGEPCPPRPPRLWVTGEAIALHQSAVSLRAAVAARRTGRAPAGQARGAKLLAESIAEHFRARARAAGLAPERYALLWTETRVGPDRGARSERVVALFRWRGDARGDVFVSWSPDARTLRERWPALGEP